MSSTVKPTHITVGPEVPEFNIFADYFDGGRATARRVELRMDDTIPALVLLQPGGESIYWPLREIRGVPDQAGDDTLVFAQSSDPLARLVVSDMGAIVTLRARCPNLRKRPPVTGLGRLAAWSVAALASVALIVLVLVPVLADQLATLLPAKGEKALGDTTFEQIRKAMGPDGFDGVAICENPEGRAVLAKMQARISKDLDLPYELTVHVLDHELINAFALPGGYVVFFDGLIQSAESPDEVAAVFAHEIGHVAARDPTRIALRSAGSIGVLGLLFGDFAGGAAVLFMANKLIEAQYTQEAEGNADKFAHERLRAAGIPPSALGGLFQTLKDKYGDEEGIVAHFASHPALGDRIAASEIASAGMPAETVPSLTDEEFAELKAICRRGWGD